MDSLHHDVKYIFGYIICDITIAQMGYTDKYAQYTLEQHDKMKKGVFGFLYAYAHDNTRIS
jgi:hypothetical protein